MVWLWWPCAIVNQSLLMFGKYEFRSRSWTSPFPAWCTEGFDSAPLAVKGKLSYCLLLKQTERRDFREKSHRAFNFIYTTKNRDSNGSKLPKLLQKLRSFRISALNITNKLSQILLPEWVVCEGMHTGAHIITVLVGTWASGISPEEEEGSVSTSGRCWISTEENCFN